MSNICVLDESTASKIAAGEVIERPSGVLKELLENAVDAGSTAVNIDIEGSGRTLIRVNDNGRGMDGEDLKLSVLRHATSKIHTFNDLNTLQTFGFRGEALYSVAAVSRMTLTSCTAGGAGNRLVLEGGKIVMQMPAPAIQGTTVEIRDLFFNVPARLKFLKSDAYERACLLKVIEESALANLNVGYRVTVNGREIYNLPAQSGFSEDAVLSRAKAILGAEVVQSLRYCALPEKGLHLFITPCDKLVALRDFQYTFINRRPIDSKTVQQAVYKAYQNARPKDRHPAFLIYMTLAPSEFDVNIHPQKRDIRFVREHDVFNFIMKTAEETVFKGSNPVEVTLPPAQELSQKPFSQPSPQAVAAVIEEKPAQPQSEKPTPMEIYARTYGYLAKAQAKTNFFTSNLPKQIFELRETEDAVPYRSEVPLKAEVSGKEEPQQPEFVPENTPSWYNGPYRYMGQLHRSYLLFENPQGLVLIDQHAAQERVLFEQYLDTFEKQNVSAQPLMFPVHVDLTPSNAEALLSWADWLKKAGFEIESFSVRTVLVRTMPHNVRLKEDDMKDFIVSLADVAGDGTKTTDALKRRMIALLACKRAVKAHDELSASEAETLLENMKKCKDGMHCPHGRPCVAQLSVKEVDKLFGR